MLTVPPVGVANCYQSPETTKDKRLSEHWVLPVGLVANGAKCAVSPANQHKDFAIPVSIFLPLLGQEMALT
ncbi:unnamed protein product [Protopolystoma xenopodis]|uniref:Uncharacterized protein n=1 Tax=Protopolystoma xenopodis TaxID=117903 RepID=A0A3S5B761_9PLAT|nr:unnamed protein product [Protopolystoma xenopodis]